MQLSVHGLFCLQFIQMPVVTALLLLAKKNPADLVLGAISFEPRRGVLERRGQETQTNFIIEM